MKHAQNTSLSKPRRLMLPAILYGTAWKEEQTRSLVEMALRAGFRGIDTANQRRHYVEAAVGEAMVAAEEAGVVTRDALFVQTKFTFRRGQDHRLPYDPAAPIAEQVEQSLASSLEHLRLAQVDSLVLHGPATGRGLTDEDWEAWQAMEAIHQRQDTLFLGVSNFSLEQLTTLCEHAPTRPHFIQNRCYAALGWDREIRDYCRQADIIYQGFSLLTANQKPLASPAIAEMAAARGCTIPQLVFAFARQVGMLPLTGTSDPQHMQQDLAALEMQLADDEVRQIESLAGP